MEQNFLNLYSKEFVLETSQIQEWINYLIEIKNQANVLRESTQVETTIHEILGKNMITVVKNYYNNVIMYSDEPSQLFSITKLFCNIFESTGRHLTQDILMLNIHVNKYLANMIQEVDKLIKNIMQNSSFNMDEFINVKKSYNLIQAKYLKLKTDIEEAHLAKKKIEVDPKLIYNISLKDKAEQKILTLLKEMQIILPELENISKEVDNKKSAFNKLMKESFELIVGCVFKNHVRIRETFFLLSKEKEDIFYNVKEIFNHNFEQIRETNYQLNDFVERKYAEIKNIFYDSIDTIIINEDDYFLANSLINISDTLLNYAENFYNLMKKRKRLLKEFSNFFIMFSKTCENHFNSYIKIIKQIQSAVQNFKDVCKGTKKTWDIILHQLSENHNAYAAFTKNLINSSNIYILKTAKAIKLEYVKFLDKWNKYSKQINSMKPQLLKIKTNKNKIISQMNELRSSLTSVTNSANGGPTTQEKNNSKIDSKISQLKEEESNIRENTNITCKKYKEIIIQSIDFLKTTVKLIRENESKKLKGFTEILDNIGKSFKNIIDRNLDLLNNQTEISINTDIYEEVKDIFSNYLEKYNITEKYFELIIKKLIKNSSFNSDDYARDKINSYLSQKEKHNTSPLNGNQMITLNQPENNNFSNNYANLGMRKNYGATYENAVQQSNNYFTQNNLQNQNNFVQGINIKNFSSSILGQENNLIRQNLNQSSISYSLVNLNLNLSNEDTINSPQKNKRSGNIKVNFDNNNLNNIAGNRFILGDNNSNYFTSPINQNLICNEDNLMNLSSNRIINYNYNNINLQEKNSENDILTGSNNQIENNTIFTLMKNNNNKSQTASFNQMNREENNRIQPQKIAINVTEDNSKQRNLIFKSENEANNERSHLTCDEAMIIDDIEKSDFESDKLKLKNMNLLKQNQIGDEIRNFNNFYNDENEDSSLIETLGNMEEEKMNFINLENFKVISNNGYENIKENEIKEYMEKLNNINSSEKADIKISKNHRAGNFILEENEIFIDSYSCAYSDKILMQGKLYVTSKKLAFESMFNNKTFFGSTKLIIPIQDIEKVEKKYNLKIFDNSLEIVTKKSKLFFTSFVSRDLCFKVVTQLLEELKRKNEENKLALENNDNQETENNLNENLYNRGQKFSINRRSNLNFGNNVLKKIDFLKRLDTLHKENLAKFEGTDQFKSFDFFKNVYYNNEPIGNIALPLIFNYIYNPEIICDELKCNKTFWESLFILRKDYDLLIDYVKSQVPKFYSDLDYLMGVLSKFEEENLNEFLDEITKWNTEPLKYNYKLTHPLKKKMMGPDKVNISNNFNIYFISPKLFIVEEICNSTGFTYCDYFVSFTQFRFYCDYKYDNKENCFKFITSLSAGFQINFFKSCMFKSIIETEGANDSEENIRFNVMEKMQQVFENQSPIFNEYFKKMTDENNQRLSINYALDNIDIENNNEDNLENKLNEDLERSDVFNDLINDKNNSKNKNEDFNQNDKNSQNTDVLKILKFKVEKKLFIRLLMYVFLVLFILYNLKVIILDKEFTFDKLINIMLIIVIFFIFKS